MKSKEKHKKTKEKVPTRGTNPRLQNLQANALLTTVKTLIDSFHKRSFTKAINQRFDWRWKQATELQLNITSRLATGKKAKKIYYFENI